MTVASTITKVIYQGNDLTKIFPVPFKVQTNDTIYCKLVIDKVEINVNDFEVLGAGTDIVQLVYPLTGPPMPAGQELVIYRILQIVQEVDLVEGDAFYASTHEDKFDYLTMIDQQQQEQLDRALQIAMSSQQSSDELMAELLTARNDAVDAAGRAEDAAASAANDAALAQQAALQTAEDVQTVSGLVDVQVLASQAVNVRKSWVLDAPLAAGEVMTMPAYYWPGRNHLDLRYNGVECYLKKAGTEPSGQYQFDEVGAITTPSNQVTLNFAVKAGDVFEAWVLASITQEKFDELEAAIEHVDEQAITVNEQAAQVAEDLVKVEALAAFFPDINAAQVGDTMVVAQDSQGQNELIWNAGGSALSERSDTVLSAPLPAGQAFTVPAYRVGRAKLSVYLDGLLCAAGSNGAVSQYQEVGADGAQSTSITFYDTLAAGRQIGALAEG